MDVVFKTEVDNPGFDDVRNDVVDIDVVFEIDADDPGSDDTVPVPEEGP